MKKKIEIRFQRDNFFIQRKIYSNIISQIRKTKCVFLRQVINGWVTKNKAKQITDKRIA